MTLYRRLEEAVAELKTRLGGLPSPIEAEDIWSDIWHQEAHNSTAIEGNTLVLQEVEKLLQEGRAVGAKPLRDYMEVKGYGDAARWVYGQALHPGQWNESELVSIQEVRHIHHLALTPVWTIAPHPHASDQEGPGSFRRHEIAGFPGGMRPPSWAEIDADMLDWARAANALSENDARPWPERVAMVHNQFERVHPFIDGNGRTGRLVLNLLLGRLGYPPAIIYKRDREKYLNALRKADAGDPGPLGELIARSVTTNLYRFVMPAVAGLVKLLPLPALATRNLTRTRCGRRPTAVGSGQSRTTTAPGAAVRSGSATM